jgi:hypothetical protein
MTLDLKPPAEGHGAFVEIDHVRADADTLHLLGMREFADRWITALRVKADEQKHPGVSQVMREIAEIMAMDRDGISVALTKAALKDKSGTINHIRKD